MKVTNFLMGLMLTATLSMTIMSCGKDDETPNSEKTLVEIASDDDNFSTLVAALKRTGLDATLSGTGPFTVFAPTNAAFTALGVDLSTLSDAALKNILEYHVFVGQGIKAADLQEGQTYIGTAAQAGGRNLSALVERTGAAVKVNGASNVTAADIAGLNGVIHAIDKVLLPLDVVGHASANTNFTSLVGALGAASGGLVDVLKGTGPFTVFAPVNSAFDAIASTTATLTADQLAKVLTYHVVGAAAPSSGLVNGDVMTVNGEDFTVTITGSAVTLTDARGNVANVVFTDVNATNGIIHVLDKVILPMDL